MVKTTIIYQYRTSIYKKSLNQDQNNSDIHQMETQNIEHLQINTRHQD